MDAEEISRLRQEVAELRQRLGAVEAALGPGSGEAAAGINARPAAVAAEGAARQEAGVAGPEAAGAGQGSRSLAGEEAGRAGARAFDPGSAGLETRIGSTLFNRVGILAILVAAALFLKLAIDSGWLGPAARVLAGLVSGAGLILGAARLRRRGYGVFGYSLWALGTALLYVSLWAACTLFSLLPGWLALLAMVLITSGNAAAALAAGSGVVAVYAAAGGYLTPLLLPSPRPSETVLFGYLLVLDLAVLWVIARRPWIRLLPIAFAATALYGLAWGLEHYREADFAPTLGFALLFTALFAAAPGLAFGVRHPVEPQGRRFEPWLAVEAVVQAATAWLLLWFLLDDLHSALRPWLALALAGLYAGLAMATARAASPRAAGLLSGANAAVFAGLLMIAAKTALVDRAAVAAWLLLALLLLLPAGRLPGRTGPPPGRVPAGLPVLAAAVLAASLLGVLLTMDEPAGGLLLNARLALFLEAIAVCALFARRLASQGMPQQAATAAAAGNGLVLLAGGWELHTFWGGGHGSPLALELSYSAWGMLLGAILMAAGFRRHSPGLRWQALVLITLAMGKVFLVDIRTLAEGYRVLSFLGLGVLLLAVSFAYQRDWLALRGGGQPSGR